MAGHVEAADLSAADHGPFAEDAAPPLAGEEREEADRSSHDEGTRGSSRYWEEGAEEDDEEESPYLHVRRDVFPPDAGGNGANGIGAAAAAAASRLTSGNGTGTALWHHCAMTVTSPTHRRIITVPSLPFP